MLCNVHLLILFPHHEMRWDGIKNGKWRKGSDKLSGTGVATIQGYIYISRHDAITPRGPHHNVKDDLWCQNVLNLRPPVPNPTSSTVYFHPLTKCLAAALKVKITEIEWGRHLGWL